MRIRSIRPEFWSSEDIASLTWEHRLIYIGLWSYVDDNGVGRDNAKLIAADLFPLEDSPPVKRIHGALSEYSRRKMITRYEVDGKQYLHVSNFHRHQKINRPSEGRYPPPTRGDAVIHDELTEDSVSTQARRPLGEGEKGRSNTSSSADADALFDEFWSAYPRKVSKKNARTRWDKLIHSGVDPQTIITGAFAYAASVADKAAEHIKHPDGWLNGERWADEPAQPVTMRQSPSLLPFTPDAPPPEIADDPAAYDRWMREQYARRSA